MFVGRYDNSIDSKSRLIVPSKFRDELGYECVIAMSVDKCLTIYPVDEWQKFFDELDEKLPDGNPKARKMKRFFRASASRVDIDKQGRVTIPQKHKEYAGIEKELVTIGSNKYIEVWSREFWDDQFDDDEDMDMSKIAEELQIYGF